MAVFITAFNEDGGTLEGTISICTLMGYRNKKIYLLDDSSNPELIITAREIADRYGIEYRHRKDRRGYKAGAINEVLKEIDAKYLLVLDADQRPSHNFLNEIVPILEADRVSLRPDTSVLRQSQDQPGGRGCLCPTSGLLHLHLRR